MAKPPRILKVVVCVWFTLAAVASVLWLHLKVFRSPHISQRVVAHAPCFSEEFDDLEVRGVSYSAELQPDEYGNHSIYPTWPREGLPAEDEARLPPLNHSLPALDAVWQTVSGTRDKFFVYSAFYDSRGSRAVRIMAATKYWYPDCVWCRLWYNGTGPGGQPYSVTVAAKIKTMREFHGYDYTAAFVLCPLGLSLPVPTLVSVVGRLRLMPANLLIIRNTDDELAALNLCTGKPDLHSEMREVGKPDHPSNMQNVGKPDLHSKMREVGKPDHPPNMQNVSKPDLPPKMKKVGKPDLLPKLKKVGKPDLLPKKQNVDKSGPPPKMEKVGKPDLPPKMQNFAKPDLPSKKQNVSKNDLPPKMQNVGKPDLPPKMKKVGKPDLLPTLKKVGKPDLLPKKQNVDKSGPPPKMEKVGKPDLPPKMQNFAKPDLPSKKQNVSKNDLPPKMQNVGKPDLPPKMKKVGKPDLLPKLKKVGKPDLLPKKQNVDKSGPPPKMEKVGKPDLPPKMQNFAKPDLPSKKQNVSKNDLPPKMQNVGKPDLPPKMKKVGKPDLLPKLKKVGKPDLLPKKQNVDKSGPPPKMEKVGKPDLPPKMQNFAKPDLPSKKQNVSKNDLPPKMQNVGKPDLPPNVKMVGHAMSDSINVCLKPIHSGYNNALHLLEWLELYMLLGAQHFTLYNRSIGPQVDCVLKDYAARGIVTLLPWQLDLASKKEIHTEGMIAAFNDCIYRSMYRYAYTAIVDLDEYLVPRKHDTLQELLKWLGMHKKTHNIASYSFQNAFFYLEWDDDPTLNHADQLQSGLVSVQKTQRCKHLQPHQERSKYICRPELVLEAGNHFVWEFVPGYTTLKLNSEEAISHHYRSCQYFAEDCINLPSVVDRTAYRYREQLTQRVRQMYHQLLVRCELPPLVDDQPKAPLPSMVLDPHKKHWPPLVQDTLSPPTTVPTLTPDHGRPSEH